MGSYGSYPNFDAWLQNFWGAGQEFWCAGPGAAFRSATNLVFGQNPAYTLDDFWAVYPQFFGLPTPLSGCTTATDVADVEVSSVNGLAVGQYVMGPGLGAGSIIVKVGSGVITLNVPAVAANSGITIQVYQGPPVPTAVIKLYLNLAYASLQFVRWQEQWYIAMSLFIAHYCTLWAQTSASALVASLITTIHGELPSGTIPGSAFTLSNPPPGGVLESLTLNGVFQTPGVDYTIDGANIAMTNTVAHGSLWATWPIQVQSFSPTASTPAAIVSQGLAGGIQTSKSVGDVSVSYQVLESLKDWGAWNLTKFGQLLVTMARVVGMGPMVIW